MNISIHISAQDGTFVVVVYTKYPIFFLVIEILLTIVRIDYACYA